jgi:hypothetical protein
MRNCVRGSDRFLTDRKFKKHLAEANEVMNKVPFLTAEEIAEMKAEGRLK